MSHPAPAGRGSFTALMGGNEEHLGSPLSLTTTLWAPCPAQVHPLRGDCSKESNLCWPNQHLCPFQLSNESGSAGNTLLKVTPVIFCDS